MRKRLGLSQERLAGILGVHVATVRRRENGEVPVLPEHKLALVAIAHWMISRDRLSQRHRPPGKPLEREMIPK